MKINKIKSNNKIKKKAEILVVVQKIGLIRKNKVKVKLNKNKNNTK